ncbi:ATP-grasp domain-containing protein [Chryseobacterium aureum]|uniref:ATP-grasp domain-containing protein n=1 Tax=Chryseobacterium aureum TaxID=2497456 RepID=UPI0013DE7FD7|nr:ATP-grasp domain-containing protein [Chryseobacterium aureum]
MNPAIIYGGMTLEDKNYVNQLLPQRYRAKSFLLTERTKPEKIENILKENNIVYPIILKPNNGCRGRNVQLIKDKKQTADYLQNYNNEDLLLEEYIDYPNEIGVFYIRMPNEKKGFISGIVEKKGIEVKGNGETTLGQLVKYNLRYHSFYPDIFNGNSYYQNYIPEKNEKVLLSTIGNHARGATFYNASDNISHEITDLFNEICFSVDGFYYGRFDVKFNTWEELKAGKNFKIIELNGAASEPTFIYDPNHSYLFAIKTIIKHWNFMYKIAKINRQNGYQFTNITECWRILKEFNPFIV